MNTLHRLLALGSMLLCLFTTAAYSVCPECCASMGGIQYCDSSAGRFVCKDGNYSSCYCTPHAIMDLQEVAGCCMWQGGVLAIDPTGLVICNNGGVSEICSRQTPVKSVSIW